MSDLSNLSDKQLLDRSRWITDRVTELNEILNPYFEELGKLRDEFEAIGEELDSRGFELTSEKSD